MSGSVAREVAIINGGGTKEMIRIPVESLVIIKRFDKRTQFGDLDKLAQDIAADGFHPNEPILVTVVKDTGKFEIVDGRRRARATEIAKAKYGYSGEVYAVPVDPKTPPKELIFKTLNSNNDNRKPFEPLEEGAYYVMLRDEMEVPEKEIAERVLKSITYVRDRIALATGFDPTIAAQAAKFIKEGVITPTAAAVFAREKDKDKQVKEWNDTVSIHFAKEQEKKAEKTDPNSKQDKKTSKSKIKGKDVSKVTNNGLPDAISMKCFRLTREKLKLMFEQTGHEQYKFAGEILNFIAAGKVFE